MEIVSAHRDKKRNQCREGRKKRGSDEERLEAPGPACQTGGSAGAQACR